MLTTTHTRTIRSRFSSAIGSDIEVLYLAEDVATALFEVRALYGPRGPELFRVLPVTVEVDRVADLTVREQPAVVETSSQELTGDWRLYADVQTLPAPTQRLGRALYDSTMFTGVLSFSSQAQGKRILAVFPERIQPPSRIECEVGPERRLLQIPPGLSRA